EHRGPQLAPRLRAGCLQQVGWNLVRLVADAVEPERGGETARGVDREDERLTAQPRRGAERGGGRDRRLADAAGPAAHHDLLRGEQLLERGQCPSSAPSASATMRVTRRP